MAVPEARGARGTVGRRRVTGLVLLLLGVWAVAHAWASGPPLDAGDPGGPRIVTSREIWIARGVRFGLLTLDTGAGLARAQVLRVDTRLAGVEVRPALAGATLGARATVGDQVRRAEALAGVNGTYYGSSGRPLGLLILDGSMVSEPVWRRTSLFFARGSGGEPRWWIGPGTFAGQVSGQGQVRLLDGVNRRPGPSELVVYTPVYGPSTETAGEATAWAVVEGKVVAAVAGGDLPIPPDGYVVAAGPRAWPPWPVETGIPLEASWGLAEPPPIGPVEWAVGGGPRLLREGAVEVTADLERFQPDVALGRAPRTAAGVDAQGRLILLTVNGRQASSVGLTLTETAHVMASLGSVDALNLDGGGSSTMVLRGDLFNLPSDGRERTVGNALLVFSSR
ncbi:phosphodiester glycosidase family protein [Limnochorda pilosa]|uniref:Exopolysaccharide biosynthesis protein n=1 Tax=Limnochorda pilosa TaxID=1555112 RepID=A0A0K2SP41_LIMPI|nr:phosphodiester glycosidase family protein [Limnochorda pilosa]BAS28903.1 exopolysaccharide biosynthesis protein [Limnochorda pilosa]